MESTHCTCTQGQDTTWTLSSSFVVVPNTIDFKTVFSTFDPENSGVLSACVVLLLLAIPWMVWARRKDRNDLRLVGKLGITISCH